MLPRLGEPFLTNKKNGTGLGIMVSQRIMANHMGQLTVRSRQGVGTCVDVVMPVDFEVTLSATQLFINRGMMP
ncbi:Sporulation kinase E [compost metagenome]